MWFRYTVLALCLPFIELAAAQAPEVHFPEVDPLYTYPLPPSDLLEPNCHMDVVDVRYAYSGAERQTLRAFVHVLKNGIRRVTTTITTHDVPVKRPHHWRRSANVHDLLYIPPKERLSNVYHYKEVSNGFHPCTKRGRLIRPSESYMKADKRATWDTTIHGDTLFLQSVHPPFTDTSQSIFFREIWTNGRLHRESFGTLSEGLEKTTMEHRYTYSGDSVIIVHRQPDHASDVHRSIVHSRSDAQGRLAEVERTFWIPTNPTLEKIRRTLHLIDYDHNGRVTCMEEYEDGDKLIRSLILNYR